MSSSMFSPHPFAIPLELPSSEALIIIELVFVSADCPSNTDSLEQLQIANIQFNNLDIIGKLQVKKYLVIVGNKEWLSCYTER